MKRLVLWLAVVIGVAFPSGCAPDDVSGVPGISASRTDPAVLGRLIIFSTLEFGGNSQLAAMQPDGSDRRRLTNDDHQYLDAAISPDGRRVVYERFTPDYQPEGVFLMNADGSGQTLLVHRSSVFDGEPAWSPDGTHIAFTSYVDGPFGAFGRIFIINVDGTGLRQLTPDVDPNAFEFDGGASWSPDGKRIVFTRSGMLYLINNDGTAFTPLPNEDGAQNPAWSPDGRYIAYQALNAVGAMRMRNPDGSNPVTISSTSEQQGNPQWSPDSRQIVFNRVVGATLRLFTINIDGTGEQRLSFGSSEDDLPYWSPFPPARTGTGASVLVTPLYTKLAPTETQQFSATVRTTNGKVISHAPVTWSSSNLTVATVSPAGLVTALDNGDVQIQAVFGGDTARAEMRVADRVLGNVIVYSTDVLTGPLGPVLAAVRPDGTGRRQLTMGGFEHRAPDISPDGRQIAFANGFGVFVIQADATGITDGATFVYFGSAPDAPAWSPDGSQIAFSAIVTGSFGDVRRILVANADGSGLHQVSPDDRASDDGPTWSPDGTRLIFTRGGVLFVINADGSGLTSLGNADAASFPDWSPDGTRAAYGTAAGIRIRNVDGSSVVAITSGQDNHPRWAPNNLRLVFSRLVDGKSQLFIINADGTGERKLSTGTGAESDPSWSPVP